MYIYASVIRTCPVHTEAMVERTKFPQWNAMPLILIQRNNPDIAL